jgi:hypothetical protein
LVVVIRDPFMVINDGVHPLLVYVIELNIEGAEEFLLHGIRKE